MKRTLIAASMLLIFSGCGSGIRKKEPTSPEKTFGPLFNDVQLRGIFPDSKTFVDAVPLESAEQINALYAAESKQPNFDLKKFVEQHFRLPETIVPAKDVPTTDVKAYIAAMWRVLNKQPNADGSSLVPLRKSYFVPGGRYREAYYWDTYFTLIGLEAAGKIESIDNMVLDFGQLIQDFGHIPAGNRSYYMSRSQPPCFALMVDLLADVRNDRQVVVQYLPQLQREYQYWMAAENETEIKAQQTARNSGKKAYRKAVFVDAENLLNRYFDEETTPRPEACKEDVALAKVSGRPAETVYRDLRAAAESGWNDSSRWLRDAANPATIHATDIVPVDLNALLYYLETLLAEGYELQTKTQYAESFRTLAAKRKAAIDAYAWNPETGFYHDYDFVAKKQTPTLSLAGVYPLFLGIASKEQAAAVAKVLENQFLKSGGLVTTLAATGQSWDAPNGWAPLHWIAIKGLRNYGFNALADTIKSRWIATNTAGFQQTGQLRDKYNVEKVGELPAGMNAQAGYGWTNAILLKLLTEE